MLHVTNGDSAAEPIEAAVGGSVLAWAEMLHEGPVPALPPRELRDVRARFLARWESGYEDALARLAARDRALDEADRVVLWFEHDLFDQLLLIQVVDRLDGGEAELIQAERYLGELTTQQLAALWPARRPLSDDARRAARRAWAAFTAGDPESLAEVDCGELPFLRPALGRLLQELPWTLDGLSLTERHVLEAVAAGARDRGAVFRVVAEREEPRFLGDAAVWLVLDRLAPLAVTPELELTRLGQALLAGEADWARDGALDRWLGGVHLRGPEPAWRWDEAAGSVRRSP